MRNKMAKKGKERKIEINKYNWKKDKKLRMWKKEIDREKGASNLHKQKAKIYFKKERIEE